MNNFDRGESAVITVTLQDENSADLDLANFDVDIVVKVYHKHLKTELGRYSVQDATVTKSDPTTDGEITFTIPDSTTATAALGVYEYQVRTEDADGSPQFRMFRGDCFYLKKALT
jgi:hypothetical protein